jgi:hypothetical protein
MFRRKPQWLAQHTAMQQNIKSVTCVFFNLSSQRGVFALFYFAFLSAGLAYGKNIDSPLAGFALF